LKNSKIKRILFYRETPGIGDVAMMMRSIELTRLKHPTAIIDVACNYIDLIYKHPALDGYLDVKEYALIDLTKSYDILINQSSPCAAYEVKHQPLIAKNRIEIFCDNASEVLQQHGYEGIQWDGLPQTLWVTSVDMQWAKNLVKNAGEGKIPLGFFWRCAEPWRDWPGMFHLMALLALEKHLALFCFDNNQKAPVEGVHQMVGYSLNKVSALVSCMRLIVSVDTAGIHLAGGLKVPILAIFGPTDPKIRLESYYRAHWMPICCRDHPCWYKPCKNLSCFKRIKAKQVYEKIMRIIYET